MPFHDPAKPLAQCYEEDMELAIVADQLGIDEFWVGEHHTMSYENIPSPEIFIGAAMRETKQIRMGPAPICLNQHHPAHVANRLIFLDHLSKGRLNLCFGTGAVTTDMELYGVDPKNNSEMVAESLDMILQLWSTDPPVDIKGKYWNISIRKNIQEEIGLGVIHKPFQKPHPPIALPITSWNSSTAKLAGKRGFQPFAHCLIPGNIVKNIWETYETAAYEAGHYPDRSDFKVARTIFLADTNEEALRLVRNNSVAANWEYVASVGDKLGAGRGHLKRDSSMTDADCNMDYWLGEQIIAGDVDTVLNRLLDLVDEVGEIGTLVTMSYDWDDKQSWVHNLELFAKELMPALNKSLGKLPA